MAQSITILTQCYRIDNLVNGSGMMFWGEMVCVVVIIASWHDQVIDNICYLLRYYVTIHNRDCIPISFVTLQMLETVTS